jgi:hypothetical protein
MVNRSDDGLPSLPQALYTPRITAPPQCLPASHGKKGRHRKNGRRGLRQFTDNQAFAIVIELVLVIIALVGVVMLILGTVWMLAVLSH